MKNFKKWYENQITYDIFNNIIYQEWLSKLQKKTPYAFFILFQNNKEILKNIFGKQDSTYTGEFRHYVWIKEYKDLKILIFTGNKGTSYEILYDGDSFEFNADKRVGEIVIEFLEDLIKKIKAEMFTMECPRCKEKFYARTIADAYTCPKCGCFMPRYE